ncbi:hypothetical protein JNUCC41_04640 [Brevibacillus sp. JNUCC-41]|nr:hypothetical protein JNUCC41_04640 [Brevibacillus sp. JNUCC-41]
MLVMGLAELQKDRKVLGCYW